MPYNMTAFDTASGVEVVSPNCLQCHAETLQGLDSEDREDAVDEHRPGEERNDPNGISERPSVSRAPIQLTADRFPVVAHHRYRSHR